MKFRVIKKSLLNFLGLNVLSFIAKIWVKSYRIEIQNDEEIKKLSRNGDPFIAAFWHGTMIIPWYIHRNYRMAALVSKSKDGEMLTRLLKSWNYTVVRGSSHIGGKEALEKMQETISEGYCLAITPDGPTGPPKKMKPGAVVLSQREAVPLFLLGTASNKFYKLKSWDNFQIPKLFSKITVIYSEPIYVRRDSERDDISNLIHSCENRLNELQMKAEEIVKHNN